MAFNLLRVSFEELRDFSEYGKLVAAQLLLFSKVNV